MTTSQKIIKYLALALAAFLIFTIFSAILGGIYGLVTALGLVKENKNIEKNISESIILNESESAAYLDIDLKVCNLNIQKGNSLKIEKNGENITCIQDGNKIEIKEKRANFFKKNSGSVIIYLPEDIYFEYVKINTGVGETDISSINARNMYIDTGIGNLKIKSGNIQNLDCNTGIGDVSITANLTGNSKFDTGIGKLKLNVEGNKEDYRVKLNKGIGKVRLDNISLNDNEEIGYGKNLVTINGGLGEIDINFIGVNNEI